MKTPKLIAMNLPFICQQEFSFFEKENFAACRSQSPFLFAFVALKCAALLTVKIDEINAIVERISGLDCLITKLIYKIFYINENKHVGV